MFAGTLFARYKLVFEKRDDPANIYGRTADWVVAENGQGHSVLEI